MSRRPAIVLLERHTFRSWLAISCREKSPNGAD